MTTLIMPMAGRGSRFGEAYSLPKPLLPVDGGIPMVVRAIQDLPNCERKIFITQWEHVLRYEADLRLRKYFPEALILALGYITDGQATTCKLGIQEFDVSDDDPIMISACDHGQLYDYEAWLATEADQSIDVAVWSITGHPTMIAKPEAWGWLRAANGKVTDVHCKYLPSDLEAATTPVITGTMFFRKAKYFLDGLRRNRKLGFRTNGEFYVDNVLNRCIENGLNVCTFSVQKYICWGLPEDYEQNRNQIA